MPDDTPRRRLVIRRGIALVPLSAYWRGLLQLGRRLTVGALVGAAFGALLGLLMVLGGIPGWYRRERP